MSKTNSMNEISKTFHCFIVHERLISLINLSFKLLVIPPEPPTSSGRCLYEKLMIGTVRIEIQQGIKEAEGIISSLKRDVEVKLKSMQSGISKSIIEKKDRIINELNEFSDESKYDKIFSNFSLLLVELTGILTCVILYQITGTWSVLSEPWLNFVKKVMDIPFLWLILSIVFHISNFHRSYGDYCILYLNLLITFSHTEEKV